MTLKTAAEVTALCSLAALGATLAYEARVVGPEVGKTLILAQDAFRDIDYTAQNANRSVIIIGATARNVELQSRKQTVLMTEEATKLNALTEKATETVQSLNGTAVQAQRLLFDTNYSLNGNVLPAVASDVRIAGEQEKALGTTIQGLNRSIAGLNGFTETLPLTGKNLSIASENMAEGTKSLAGVAADAKYEADKIVAPVKWPSKIFGWVSKGLQVVWYAIHF